MRTTSLLAALLLPLLVAAQETAPPAETAPAATVPVEPVAAAETAEPARQIQEITVTAQKTEQSLQEVPISVTALGGDFIQETGSASLADVSLYVPNARIDADDPGSPQIFIRGFGTNSFNPSFESSVGLVQDEVYFGRPGYFTEALFDIDRVEILRGPQGTLFGKNTIAGVFNVLSRPVTRDFTADGTIYYGEHQEQRLDAGAGGMFNDWIGARGSVLYRKTDGQLYNTTTQRREEEQKQEALRLKLRVLPFDSVDSELTAVTSRTTAPFWPYQLMRLDADTRSYLEPFDPQVEDDPLNFLTSYDTRGFIEKGSDTVSLKTAWDAGELGPLKDFTPVLVLGGSRFFIDQLNELDVSPADIARLDNHERHEQTSAELRFSAKADSLFGFGDGVQMVAGGFYYDSKYSLLAQVLAGRDFASYATTCDFQILAQLAADNSECVSPGIGLPGLGLITGPLLTDGDLYRFDYDQRVTSQALFGQFTWNLTEHWAVTPGLRINQERKRVNARGHSECQGREDTGRPCIIEQVLMANDYDKPGLQREETDLSPKFALQYFGDAINYYASYARGFKSSGFNSISFTGEKLEYQPEVAQTYEVGGKGRFLDGALAANLTLYYTQFDNLQLLAFNGFFFDVSNAGKAHSQGLEADFQWLTPWEPLKLLGSFGLLDARYDRYDNAPAPVSRGVNQVQSLAGQRVAFAPSATGTLTPVLGFALGPLRLSLSGDLLYQGDQFTDTDLDPATYVPAYLKYSARVSVSDAESRWTLALGGVNLTDERVLNQVTDASFFPGTYFAQQAPGRQLYATLTFKI